MSMWTITDLLRDLKETQDSVIKMEKMISRRDAMIRRRDADIEDLKGYLDKLQSRTPHKWLRDEINALLE